jgi:hypothetical protein
MDRQLFVIEPLPGREICDFCATSATWRLYACHNFVVPRTKHTVFQHESIGAWSACDRCAVLIDAGHWAQLTDRALRRFARIYGVPRSDWDDVREQLAEIHQLFKEHMIKEA